jgi:hypothetical protein
VSDMAPGELAGGAMTVDDGMAWLARRPGGNHGRVDVLVRCKMSADVAARQISHKSYRERAADGTKWKRIVTDALDSLAVGNQK